MRSKRHGSAPNTPPIPYAESPDALDDVADALDFMDTEQRRRKIGVPYEWADNWYGDYLRAVNGLCQVHGGAVRMRTQKHIMDGEPMFRENFTTSGGAPWSIYYTLDEDRAGNALRLIVWRVRHGRAKGNP